MKTSVNMVRKMGNFEVYQRTKDSFFNAADLLTQWNKNNKTKREMKRFLDSPKTKEFISEICKKESQSQKCDMLNISALHINKGRNTKQGKTKDEIWMHPMLFLDFAMYLNPRFKYDVLKFVYDNLMAFRNDAGDNYIGLSNAVQKLNGCDYSQMAKGLNWIVFNIHKKGIRQEATQEQLNELNEIQKNFAFAIDMGYIKSFEGLIFEMRRMYNEKWNK